MARENNFLLGNGEQLTKEVHRVTGGGKKRSPYSFEKSKERIGNRLELVNSQLSLLPDEVCPNDEAVAIVTMHPRYISKSDFPEKLLRSLGFKAIGSRSRIVVPEVWGTQKDDAASIDSETGESAEKSLTEDIFIAGKRTVFKNWSERMSDWEGTEGFSEDLTHIEDLVHFSAENKLKSVPKDQTEAFFEVVLHNAYRKDIVDEFIKYSGSLNADALINRRRDIKGLTFLPVYASVSDIRKLAAFSFLRVARGMPKLRMFRPTFIRSAPGYSAELPAADALDTKTKAVVFDGGLPKETLAPLSKWVNYIEPPGIPDSIKKGEEHGLAVTSALLFGPISTKKPLQRPLCNIDHVRVLGTSPGVGGDLLILDVLDRITNHLKNNMGKYQFVNLSIGPQLAIDDDEVNRWTAELDQIFSGGEYVTTVAVGNDGELDEEAGLNRIQPPADGVNMIAVGALDSQDSEWSRATYSCIGPGRCPGVIKPDGMAFGGTLDRPFNILMPDLSIGGTAGTSFAAPLTLQSAVSIDVQLNNSLSALAIRALMIHRADSPDSQVRTEIGWGKFETDPLRLITCDDNEALVIYQGELPLSQYLRAEVPLPPQTLAGMVQLTATLVISPEVDPEFPSAYTRSGLTVAFRPNSTKYKKQPKYPDTKSFFSKGNIYGCSERKLREDGHKWEPCLKHSQKFRGRSLHKPVFDIYYNHREGGASHSSPEPIPFCFIVSLKAPKVLDLYNQIVRTYANVLIPIRPRYRIETRVR